MTRLLSTPIIAVLASVAIANGQGIGTEICSCSPTSYEFTLDFSLTCPPVNITVGDAVEATSCLISTFGDPNVQDLVPVTVEGIDILELGQNLRVVAQTDIDDILVDGDTFAYTSYISDPNKVEAVVQVPRALQLNILGINADGDRLINVFIVTFTNGCGNYPVFQEGQSAGWARFTGLGPGSPELCSSAPQDLPVPSTVSPSPTKSPITLIAPTSFVAPSAPTPVESPVDAPSELGPVPIALEPTPPPIQVLVPTPPPIQVLIPTDSPAVVIPTEDANAPIESEPEETNAPVEPDPQETNAPVEPEPKETDAPIDPEPEETDAPVVSEPVEIDAPVEPEPEETDAPVESEPVETDAPVEPEPEETDAPIEPEPEETDAPVAPEPEETNAPVEPEPEETDAPVEPEPEETDAPVEVPEPATSSPIASATSAPVMTEEDDIDLPTDFFPDITMSMSMPMKDPLLGDRDDLNDLLTSLSGATFGFVSNKPSETEKSPPAQRRTQEFGASKPLVETVDTKDGVTIPKRLRRGRILKK